VSWLLASDGRILRGEAGLAAEQVAATGSTLRAGSAVSDLVAWAVGDRGAIWRTTDGRRWTPVTAPSVADLVAVAATSEDAATITTATGGRFETTDGGRSWTPR
jgi:photosystem II stability/assembly factor-like uncharacterized protein